MRLLNQGFGLGTWQAWQSNRKLHGGVVHARSASHQLAPQVLCDAVVACSYGTGLP
jgi:hypothetical protein